jgi:hypothetical protein
MVANAGILSAAPLVESKKCGFANRICKHYVDFV